MKIEKFEKLEKVFKVIEWIIWLGLFSAALYYVHDVYLHYHEKTTNVKTYTKQIDNITNPTITVCFEPSVKRSSLKKHNLELKDYLAFNLPDINSDKTWQEFHDEEMSYILGTDFVISMEYNSKNNKDFGLQNTNMCELESELEIELENSTNTRICLNDTGEFEDSELIKKVEKVYTLWDGLCYKITPKINATKVLHNYFKLEFNESISDDDIPNKVRMHLTSENNSYGIITSKWTEGDVFKIDIKLKDLEYYSADLTYNKYERLGETSNCECGCQHRKCIAIKSIEEIKNSTSYNQDEFCLPINYKTLIKADQNANSTPICNTIKDTKNNSNHWNHVYNAIGHCAKPCQIWQYDGSLNTWIGYVENNKIAILQYFFSTDETFIHEEYLLFDWLSIVGYVGGTLGLFIGFSFVDQFNRGIVMLTNYCRQKSGQVTEQRSEIVPDTPNRELGVTGTEQSNGSALHNSNTTMDQTTDYVEKSSQTLKLMFPPFSNNKIHSVDY